MSKGTKLTALRIPPALEDDLYRAIESRNNRSRLEPFTKTGFILAAIKEKLAHLERSKGKKRRPAEKGVES